MSEKVAEAPARFSVTHQQLTEAVKTLSIAVPGRPPVPVLGGIVTVAQGSTLILRTYDYEVSAAVRLDAEPGGMGMSLLDHAELTKVLAACVAGESPAAARRTAVGVAGDVLSTPHLSMPLTLHPLAEYPALPPAAPPLVTVDGPEWFRQVARVLPATGTDDTLPNLCTVRLEVKEGALRMAACDRHRLAVAEVPAQKWDDDQEPDAVALVPSDVLKLISKRLGKYTGPISVGVHASQDEKLITFTIGPVELTVRGREGAFPGTNALLPSEAPMTVEADRTAMVKAVKKAHALTKAKGAKYLPVAIEFQPDGQMIISPTMEDGAEQAKVKGVTVHARTVAGTDQLDGAPLGANGSYLLDALNAFAGDSVTLHIRSVSHPFLFTDGNAITGEGYRHVLATVRLQE